MRSNAAEVGYLEQYFVDIESFEILMRLDKTDAQISHIQS